MNDCTMCEGKNCSRKEECFRYRAIPTEWQSWALLYNVCNEKNGYELFYKIGNSEIRSVEECANQLPKD